MTFLTFTPGQVFTASHANTLIQQSLIVCTSTTRPSSPAEGWHIYETDTNKMYFYSGSVWTLMHCTPAAIQRGEVVVSRSGSSSGSATITYSPAFTAAPIVTATINSSIGSTSASILRVYNGTATSCTINLTDANGASQTDSVNIYWMAML